MLRYNGGAAIAACGEGAAPLVPCMIATLEDEDAFTLLRKINALGELGPVARAALPKLRAYESGEFPDNLPKELTEGTAEDIQFAATMAICMITAEEAGARVGGRWGGRGERRGGGGGLGGVERAGPPNRFLFGRPPPARGR